MRKTIIPLIAVSALLLASCGNDKDPYLIEKGHVGPLTNKIQMKQIDSIFEQDSIVKLNPRENALGTQGEVEIYEPGGTKLLLISPEDENDPEATITNVQIFDERYKTEKGLTANSTFGELKASYEIEGIENAINSVVVFLKDTDIYITIDKKELPENVRYDYSSKIQATQIPDNAKFKYFMIGWEKGDKPVEKE